MNILRVIVTCEAGEGEEEANEGVKEILYCL